MIILNSNLEKTPSFTRKAVLKDTREDLDYEVVDKLRILLDTFKRSRPAAVMGNRYMNGYDTRKKTKLDYQKNFCRTNLSQYLPKKNFLNVNLGNCQENFFRN